METNRKLLRVLSHTLKRYYFTVWLMCSVVLSVETDCPNNCRCNDTSLICEDYALPFEVPRWTRNLTLSNTNMTVLIHRAFTANGTDVNLQELSLQDNNIQVIESCAFCGLSGLQSLDLSRNRLETVSSDAFFGLENASELASLRHLKKLNLSGNSLKTIPLWVFHNFGLTEIILTNNSITTLDKHYITELNKHNNTLIYLSGNPFECTCEFYGWLQNCSHCADAKDLCADKNDVSVLDNCKKHRKPQDLRSFVLLGIVLALIGVVFLMVLYLNRRGIKRWLNNIREACRDQMEVYHYRYEQDSDPRLANVAV